MLSKKNRQVQADTPNTVIGKGVTLEAAKLTGQESVRIDGAFKGDIDISGTLVLGEECCVTGDIHARDIIAAGRVNGHMRCDTVLHMAATARITGNVEAESLIVDEGTQIEGTYKIGDDASGGSGGSSASSAVPGKMPSPVKAPGPGQVVSSK
jgi:cytoskeletal protein CcmA (bactofilin family)